MSDDKPIVRVFRANVEDWHPYPWRFEIKWRGVHPLLRRHPQPVRHEARGEHAGIPS